MESIQIADGLLWFVAFLFSTTFHEAAHAYVAWRGGDETAYRGGQVSLSPLPHIRREPIGMIVVPLLTALTQGWAIGWASTPYDPRWEARYPRRAALMAASGPLGNLIIAVAAFATLKIGLATGQFVSPAHVSFEHLVDVPEGGAVASALAGKILSIFLMLNVLLFAFNLLPFPPLDGGSAIGLVLPQDAAAAIRGFTRTPGFSLLGLIFAWRVFPYIASPLFSAVLFVLHPGAVYG